MESDLCQMRINLVESLKLNVLNSAIIPEEIIVACEETIQNTRKALIESVSEQFELFLNITYTPLAKICRERILTLHRYDEDLFKMAVIPVFDKFVCDEHFAEIVKAIESLDDHAAQVDAYCILQQYSSKLKNSIKAFKNILDNLLLNENLDEKEVQKLIPVLRKIDMDIAISQLKSVADIIVTIFKPVVELLYDVRFRRKYHRFELIGRLDDRPF